MTNKLLPDNSTKLEKDLADLFDQDDLVGEAITSMATAKYGDEPPESFLPSLIWEFNIGGLSKWIGSDRDLFLIGKEFSRIIGTPRALKLGLSLIGVDPIIEETSWGHWAVCQLDINQFPSGTTLADIKGIFYESAPLRSVLLRLYHGLNVAPLILNSENSLLNYNILNNYAGWWDDDLDLWLYFRDTQGFVSEYTNPNTINFGGSSTKGWDIEADLPFEVDSGTFVNAGYDTYMRTYLRNVIMPAIPPYYVKYSAQGDSLPE